MLSAFLYFVGGALAMRLFQFVLSIQPNYHVWKHTEYTVLQILTDIHINRLTATKIVELAYDEAGKSNELPTVKRAIEQKYDALINTCLENMKNNLPYKVNYNTIREATEQYLQKSKEKRDGES